MKEIDGKIYKITNMVNGKCYIGLTRRNVRVRFRQHISRPARYIGRAIRKYGAHNFVCDVIQCKIKTQKELNDAEEFWIKYFNSTDPNIGYNLNSGGNQPSFVSEETRRKISENHADFSGDKNPRYGKCGDDSTIGGEKNPKAKLNRDLVVEIRENKELSRKQLAEKYKVSLSTIDYIINNKTWRFV